MNRYSRCTPVALVLIALPFAISTLAATAPDTVTGQLELVWGDQRPGPHTGPATQLLVGLADDHGRRITLDTNSALRAAGSLYSLFGQKIAVDLGTSSPGGVQGKRIAQAIVPLGAAATSDTQGTLAVTGPQRWVSILCKFGDDDSEPNPLAYFTGMYANQSPRLDHYWREVSYAKINIAGSTAYGWFTLPHPRSHYISDNHADLDKLLDDCTAAADPVVDFSQFVGINQMFNGNLDGYAWGGSKYRALDGPYRVWRVTWQPPWSYHNLAPLAHEMGHGFGLPHANNSDGDNDPYDNPWDVMSDAWDNATHDSAYGTLPKHLNIWSRDHLGWVDNADKLLIGNFGEWPSVALDFAELANVAGVREIEILVPGAPSSETWTIEARQRSGIYDGDLAATAVIVHHVDSSRQEPAWSFDKDSPPADVANNRGSYFLVGDSRALGNGLRLTVTASTATGFLVDVTLSDVLFSDGFDP